MFAILWLSVVAVMCIYSDARQVDGYSSLGLGFTAAVGLLAAVFAAFQRSSRIAGEARVLCLLVALAAGVTMLFSSAPLGRFLGLSAGLLIVAGMRGTVLAVQLALSALGGFLVFWLLPIVGDSLQFIRPLEQVLYAVARGLGLDVSSALAGSMGVSLHGSPGAVFGTSSLHLGLRDGAVFATGGAIWLALDGRVRDWRWVARFGLALSLGLIISWFCKTAAALETESGRAYLDTWWRVIAGVLPVSAVLIALFASRPWSPGKETVSATAARGDAEAGGVGARSRFGAVVPRLAVTCGAIGCVLSFAWDQIGAPEVRAGERSVRVGIDVGHSDWERIDLALGRETLGTRTLYNYWSWVDLLETYYGSVSRLEDEIGPAALADLDVLILKMPTRRFGESEVDAIEAFVEQGGGLYLVGDHTDVFGSTTAMNPVSTRFGIRYRPDAVFDIQYEGGFVSRGEQLPAHPLAAAADPLHGMTSCSIETSGRARPIAWMPLGFADDADYSINTFFGDSELSPDEPVGPITQIAVARHGEGRVLAFADSTLFSNFSVNLPGVKEYAVLGVEWLSRSPLSDSLRWVLYASSVLLLLAGFLGGTFLGGAGTGLVTPTLYAMVGLLLGSTVTVWHSQSSLAGAKDALAEDAWIYDQALSEGRLPIWHQAHERSNEFWSLWLSFQRSGLDVGVRVEVADAQPEGKARILVYPKLGVDPGAAEKLLDSVRQGQVLVVFDDYVGDGSLVRPLADACGVAVGERAVGRRLSAESIGMVGSGLVLGSSVAFEGGDAVVIDDAGQAVAVRAKLGRGAIVFCGIAVDFADTAIGGNSGPESTFADTKLSVLYNVIDAAVESRVADQGD